MVVARLIFVRLSRRDSFEEAKKIWNTIITPVMAMKGFCGAFQLLSKKRDEAINVTLWDSENNAAKAEMSLNRNNLVHKSSSELSAPVLKLYDVITKIYVSRYPVLRLVNDGSVELV